jgi:hypothetical protein
MYAEVPACVPVIEAKYGGLVFLVIILICILFGLGEFLYIMSTGSNWADIRCTPYVMPFAGFFGHDVNENFRFCMSESFKRQAGEQIAPMYKFFAGFTGVLSTLIDSTNSLRLGFATFMGGFVTVISEFNDRFRMFMSQIKLSGQRMRMLMYRIYATFYAMMYMALSSIRAVNNFGGTMLFGFLDTFCFDPSTLIEVDGRGQIPVRDVKIGDVLLPTRSRVTACFKFAADGQPMVRISRSDGGIPILVSTNHYIEHAAEPQGEAKWIRAEDHPAAMPAAPWNGGPDSPIICFNTHDNRIPIGPYVFRDYDETPDGAEGAINWTAAALNAGMGAHRNADRKWKEMTPAFEPAANICLRDGTVVPAADIRLGDVLKPTGDRVIGIIDIEVREYLEMADGKFTPSTLFWNEPSATWERLGDIYPQHIKHSSEPLIFKSLIVLSGSRIQFQSGFIIRDYMEVASPWAEDPYSSALRRIGI